MPTLAIRLLDRAGARPVDSCSESLCLSVKLGSRGLRNDTMTKDDLTPFDHCESPRGDIVGVLLWYENEVSVRYSKTMDHHPHP